MKARIVKIEEEGDSLRVTVEHEYGIDKLGIGFNKKEFNYKTGEPKWIEEVKRLLEKKYKNAKPINQEKYLEKELDIPIEKENLK